MTDTATKPERTPDTRLLTREEAYQRMIDQLDRYRALIETLTKALERCQLHVSLIRLAPERRYLTEVITKALAAAAEREK